MAKKIFIILFFSLLISNCDYSPVYLKNDNLNYTINIIETSGDNEINKSIIKELNKQSKNNSIKKFDIKINTNFSRNVLSRNAKGSATDLELKATSLFIFKANNKEQAITIEEKLNYKKLSNNYEQNNYEKTVKKNIASSIVRKLILRLTILND